MQLIHTTHHMVRLCVLTSLALALCAAPLGVKPLAAQESPTARIDQFETAFDREGVTFTVVTTIDNMQDREVEVSIWFPYLVNNELMGAPSWAAEDYVDSAGNLVVTEYHKPLLNNGYVATVALFVPYDLFPSVDYDFTYYPYVNVRAKDTRTVLLEETLRDHAIQVLGSEPPLGFRAWLSVRDLVIHDLQEGWAANWHDEVLLLYGMSEIAATDEEYTYYTLGENDLIAWGPYQVQADEHVAPEYFDWAEVTAAGDSEILLSALITEVDNMEQAQEFADAVNSFADYTLIVGAPFAVTNPAVAGGLAVFKILTTMLDVGTSLTATLNSDDSIGGPSYVFTPEELRRMSLNDETWDKAYRYSDGNFDYELTLSVYVQAYLRQLPAQ